MKVRWTLIPCLIILILYQGCSQPKTEEFPAATLLKKSLSLPEISPVDVVLPEQNTQELGNLIFTDSPSLPILSALSPDSTPNACVYNTIPSTLSSIVTPEAIQNYLQDNLGSAYSGGKAFCAFDLMGYEPINTPEILLYMWVLCQEYYPDQGNLALGSGVSLPVVLVIYREKDDSRFIENKIPGDGSYYGPDVRNLFPEKLWSQIFTGKEQSVESYNQRSESLNQCAELDAYHYYASP